jgi:hypothetical protein
MTEGYPEKPFVSKGRLRKLLQIHEFDRMFFISCSWATEIDTPGGFHSQQAISLPSIETRLSIFLPIMWLLIENRALLVYTSSLAIRDFFFLI